MISHKEALELLRKNNLPENVIVHCLNVEKLAIESAEKISKHHNVNLILVSRGALLHDIGRAKTHDIKHGVEGAKILRKLNLPELACFAERHIGAGITKAEAEDLGLPTDIDLMPTTIEEKIVANADNFFENEQVLVWEGFQEYWSKEFEEKPEIYQRILALAKEIKQLETN